MFISDEERVTWRVVEDYILNTILQYTLEILPQVMIQEHIEIRNRWFRKPVVEKYYSVYLEYLDSNSQPLYEAVEISRGRVSLDLTKAYLTGLLNGATTMHKQLVQ